MKRLYFISTIVSLALFAGCMVDDIDYSTPGQSSNDVVTVIGRMTRLDEYDVATRSAKDEAESKLTSMAMAIFPVKSDGSGFDNDGKCVYYQYSDNQAELLFTIDRVSSNFTKNARYAMYVFCNMPGMNDTDANDNVIFGVGNTLDDMLRKFYELENIDIPTNGFPMIGSLGDTFSTSFERDGKVFILSPTADGSNTADLLAPKVDGTVQTLLNIPMDAMYAKVNFSIEVSPDQTIEGNFSPQFTFEGCTVNNVPSSVDFSSATNSDTAVLNSSFSVSASGSNVASGANKVTFSFYLPERLLTPATTWENYQYPFGKGSDIRDEDLVYRQRYKSKLLRNDQKAVNIVISGRYRDHQNHYWDVDYTIYLGADNYGDFNILRNAEYNNFVTIRGIQTSSDMSDKEGAISIDHRVNIDRTQPGIISLRREVMLDSHFEVRPLRVRKSDIGDVGNINAVKVEVVNPTTTNWMRLERSFGDGTPADSPETTVNGQKTSIYIDSDPNSPSYGKRKFFTYNLIDGVNANATDETLKDNTEVILPLSDDTECCWIYVDECTESGDGIRAGIVRVTYGNLANDDSFTATTDTAYPVVNYIINQRKLFKVKYDDPTTTQDENREYYIEYEEEYLHNFDADDSYGQTEEEGMQWGLNNVQLSYDHRSISFSDGLKEWLTSNARPYYDYYILKYDKADADNAGGELHSYEGFNFCLEIINEMNGVGNHDTESSNNIDVLQLDQKPKSAVEYCYNKNKRFANGQVASSTNTDNVNWYLPAIDEMEDIIISKYGNGLNSYARFIDFQGKFYWSCQPAFIRNFAYYGGITSSRDQWGAMYVDNTTHARATKVDYLGNDQFDYARSGIANLKDEDNHDVYYNAWYYAWGGLLGTSHYTPDDGTITIDRKVTITLQEVEGQPGYKPRNSMARVRCVRKAN